MFFCKKIKGDYMKIQNNFASSYAPNFGAFRIESPKILHGEIPENLSPAEERDYKFRGTERFLYEETKLIDAAKTKTGNSGFEDPLNKIIELIKRQRNNPYDMVMYAVEKENPKDDEIFFEIRSPQGDILNKRKLFNRVHTIEQKPNKFDIISEFYSVLNYGEKTADEYNKTN